MAAVNGEIASDKCSKQKEAVFVKSNVLPDSMNNEVRGYDFNQGVDYSKILSSYSTTGFQATALALAIEEIKRMIKVKYEPSVFEDALDALEYDSYSRKKTGCTIFLGYTSNMISCGIRECIRFLVQHNMVDCIVTSAGGVEEDFIKCLAPTYLGDFGFTGSDLRKNGINRIGNLLVPNDNYCKFEDWVLPIFDEMLNEQKSQNMKWTPSKLIRRLGQKIDNENSVYYWAYKNNIPVFCPGLTDGSLGDMLYFYSYKNPGLTLDIIEDVRLLNDTAVHSEKTGIIILGGGLIKHHICNANLMRNGAEFAVFVNTAQEFDGSDSGAQPDEAVSWGKIKIDAKPVKVHCDASIVFPLIVAETFAKFYHSDLKSKIS